ncbi:hypothetical protein OVY01_22555 [Robbsia sp. Bb-Pol-6]|uniref:Uncharacterized protein n=1 Tax=Robbsia betulipollinis TaxID=2981849 RepID=A0ABT3ZTM1_9BURK|nr:hypothetical protein [Robbsia betulipollinis]MCY0389924.1 hypothetical protein [Robbsia betulipollinis]
MEVGVFLKERVHFIRQFYAMSAGPFIERKRLIDAQEEPFVPPYSEDGEPPFNYEWLEADTSLHVLGYSCVTMLSGTLKAFFKTWEELLCITRLKNDPVDEIFKKNGFIEGYRVLFEDRLGISFAASGVEFELLKNIVITRNNVQHAEELTKIRSSFLEKDVENGKRPYFSDDQKALSLVRVKNGTDVKWVTVPQIAVSSDRGACQDFCVRGE